METIKRTLGIVCALSALSALAGCAGSHMPAAHATTAAALSDDDVAEKKPVVRLRMEAAEDATQEAAFLAVRRTLVEQGFVVGSGFVGGYDADLVIHTEPAGTRTRVALAARLGSRGMIPVTVDVAGDGSVADDDAMSDLAMRWQRRFSRSPRLDRHLEPDLASPAAWAAGPHRSPEAMR